MNEITLTDIEIDGKLVRWTCNDEFVTGIGLSIIESISREISNGQTSGKIMINGSSEASAVMWEILCTTVYGKND